MPRYILSRYTTPVSETYNTLDEALAACMASEDGAYIIDVRSVGVMGYSTQGQYQITMERNIMTVGYRD